MKMFLSFYFMSAVDIDAVLFAGVWRFFSLLSIISVGVGSKGRRG